MNSGKPHYIDFAMLQTLKRFMPKITPGVFVSAFIHAIILALLVFGLPQLRWETEEPEAIQVQLVHLEDAAEEEEPQPSEPPAEPEPDLQETASIDQPDEQALRFLPSVTQFGEEEVRPSEPVEGDARNSSETAEATPTEKPVEEPVAEEQTVEELEAPDAEAIPVPATGEEKPKPEESTETARALHDDESTVAITAIDQTPRGERAGNLCVTELRNQLLSTLSTSRLDLPRFLLPEGNVLQIRRGKFRSNTGWYKLEFRCEIDDAATKIVSFEFAVGEPIPPADYAKHGIPAS